MQPANKQRKPKAKKPKQPKQPSKMMVTVSSNAPVSKGYNGAIKSAQFRMGRNGKILVCHSELVGDVLGTAGFTPVTFSINPGLQSLFLWLSNIATNYESYVFKKLKLRYLPACSTDNAGSVYTSVDFDPADPAPSTERQLANYQGTKFSPPWKAQTYDCLANNLRKRSSYFVRSGPLTATEDLGLFDTGNLIIATVGCAAVTVGKLWVDYEVEFSTPDFPITGVGRALSAKLTATDNFVTVPTITGNAPLTASVAANVLTLTASQPYQCVIACTVTGTGLTSATVGGTAAELLRNSVVNTGGTSFNQTITINFSAAGQTATYAVTTPTAVASVGMRFGQYDISTLA